MRKAMGRVEIKDADKGLVDAVFSVFNVVDHDFDVTLPGAFEDGAAWKISAYGHGSWSGRLPIGKGTVRTTSTEAVLEGQFFMDVPDAVNTFKVVKNMGPLQEWSYSVHPTKHSYGEHEGQRVRFLEKMRAGEVSPVLEGAGINTRTLSVKGLTLPDEAALVLASVDELADRAADVMAKRQGKGKSLGAESRALVEQIEAQLARFKSLLDEPSDESDTTPLEALQLVELHAIARTRGINVH